jgi:hypothetical protein
MLGQPDIVLEPVLELGLEGRIALRHLVGAIELQQ